MRRIVGAFLWRYGAAVNDIIFRIKYNSIDRNINEGGMEEYMKQSMFRPILIIAILIIGESSAAMAECESKYDALLAKCITSDLWTTDQKINQIYQELMARYSDSKKENLRDEQRSWLRARNSTCHLDAKESNREKWIQAISSDYQKTVCVVLFTKERIATLEAYQKNGIANAVRQETLPVLKEEASRPASPGLPPDYTTRGDVPRSDGKWYFEIKVNQAELAKHGNASLYLGLEDHLGNGYGKLLYAYGNTTQRTVFNYGFAVDLENGKLYRHVDGEWLVAAPGSAKGMDLKLNRRYFVKVTSSAPVFNPLRSPVNVVSINTGEKAFDYSLPAGYRPFNGQ
ncbi:MAG TPA: lysozyme inhibitor LprI family protein [Thiobacillus sp.]|nr:lysozyme inhibitor LprI family protein [Thiobacillus sp.]